MKFGKVIEAIINSELIKHLTLHGFVSDKQHGFHFSRSAEDVLLVKKSLPTLARNDKTWTVALDKPKGIWQGLACWSSSQAEGL